MEPTVQSLVQLGTRVRGAAVAVPQASVDVLGQNPRHPTLPRRPLEPFAQRAQIRQARVEHDAVVRDRPGVAKCLELVTLHGLHLAMTVAIEDASTPDEPCAELRL